MKLILTKKETDGYLDLMEETLVPVIGKEAFMEFKLDFLNEIHNGMKMNFISVRINKKFEFVYEIDPKFVVKVFNIYGKYLAIIVPQVISIVNATKALMNDIADITEEDDEDPCRCKCK